MSDPTQISPPPPPMSSPWHFDVHDMRGAIPRELAEGVHADIVSSPNVMMSVVRVAPNATSIAHSHAEEQWGVLLEGSCTRFQGGEAVEMQVGNFWCTPGGVVHNLTAGPQGALTLEIFCPPRPGYLPSKQSAGERACESAGESIGADRDNESKSREG